MNHYRNSSYNAARHGTPQSWADKVSGHPSCFVAFTELSTWVSEHGGWDNVVQWCLHNCTSGIADESNEAVILKYMKQWEGKYVLLANTGGSMGAMREMWVQVKSNGRFTPAYLTLFHVHTALKDYPILDEDDYSEREYQATLTSIEDTLRTEFDMNPDRATAISSEIYAWLRRSNEWSWQLESTGDEGASPSSEAVAAAVAHFPSV